MKRQLIYQNSPIAYHMLGKGKTVVLLHGFLESKAMWKDFIPYFSNKFRVITMDLPGHGQSGQWAKVHTMEFMADTIKAVLDHESIHKATLIGHSMGGYVSLAFAQKYPKNIRALGLFHSQAASDSVEARKNRDRTIDIVQSDSRGFIKAFIPDLFAPENQERFAGEIGNLKMQAERTPVEGVVAALEGMKLRKDSLELLKSITVPVLFIAGKKDKRIPLEIILQQAALPHVSEISILGDAGHMGYIEEKDYCLKLVNSFIERSMCSNKNLK